MFGVSRLVRVKKRISCEIVSKPRLHNTLSKFGQEGEIRDRTITGEVFLVKSRLLKERIYHAVLERRWKSAR